MSDLIDIQDNFLPKREFDHIHDQILGTEMYHFPWILSQIISNTPSGKDPRELYGKELLDRRYADNIQLCHGFYDQHAPLGETFQILYPILQKIQPVAILRIKANLLMCRDTIIESNMHNDVVDIDKYENADFLRTSIFYLNTCDGYTKFENGDKVQCVANRFVSFPQSLKHCGSTCTDQPFRSVINFNYVPGDS